MINLRQAPAPYERKSSTILGLAGVLIGVMALSDCSEAADGSWLIEAKVGAGYSKPQVLSGSPAPTLGDASVGVELGYFLVPPFALGVSSEYHFVLQYSDVDPSVGNMRGSRLELANPAVIFLASDFLIQATYIFLDHYSLTNPTSTGFKITYAQPRGWRVEAAYAFFKPVYLGFKFESVSYSLKENSSGTSLDLSSNRLSLMEYGLFATYLF